MLHHIQKNIINVLASKDPARYADIKPDGMDGNQFTYHLKQLITDKLIQKNDDGTYSLTHKGRTYLIYRYESLDEAAHSIFLVIVRHDKKHLLRKRKVQPLINYSGFIHGEPVANEPLAITVQKRVLKKTGLAVKEISIHGSGLIRMRRDGELQSFSHAIIIEATVPSDELAMFDDETGENFWTDNVYTDPIDKLIPSTRDILAFADDASIRWFDWTYEL